MKKTTPETSELHKLFAKQSSNHKIVEHRRELQRLSSSMPLLKAGPCIAGWPILSTVSNQVLTASKYWDFTHLSRQPITVFDHPHSKNCHYLNAQAASLLCFKFSSPSHCRGISKWLRRAHDSQSSLDFNLTSKIKREKQTNMLQNAMEVISIWSATNI